MQILQRAVFNRGGLNLQVKGELSDPGEGSTGRSVPTQFRNYHTGPGEA